MYMTCRDETAEFSISSQHGDPGMALTVRNAGNLHPSRGIWSTHHSNVEETDIGNSGKWPAPRIYFDSDWEILPSFDGTAQRRLETRCQPWN